MGRGSGGVRDMGEEEKRGDETTPSSPTRELSNGKKLSGCFLTFFLSDLRLRRMPWSAESPGRFGGVGGWTKHPGAPRPLRRLLRVAAIVAVAAAAGPHRQTALEGAAGYHVIGRKEPEPSAEVCVSWLVDELPQRAPSSSLFPGGRLACVRELPAPELACMRGALAVTCARFSLLRLSSVCGGFPWSASIRIGAASLFLRLCTEFVLAFPARREVVRAAFPSITWERTPVSSTAVRLNPTGYQPPSACTPQPPDFSPTAGRRRITPPPSSPPHLRVRVDGRPLWGSRWTHARRAWVATPSVADSHVRRGRLPVGQSVGSESGASLPLALPWFLRVCCGISLETEECLLSKWRKLVINEFRMESFNLGRRILTLLCSFYLLASVEVDGYDVPMTLLKSAVGLGAVCLDGSPPAYHLSPGFGSGSNNWLVHMEGGGWCKSVQDCLARKNTFRGSSKYMKPLSFSGILGNSQKLNPDFYNWNKVKIRYCDGSSFTGDVDKVDSATGLYFRGAKIWFAVMQDLLSKGMNKAEKALLSGCSAGGLASILHCDKFRDLLPRGANVKCFSDAGYFVNLKDISGTEYIKAYYSSVVNTHGSAKNLPSSCTSRLTPSMCFFPQYVVPQMRTPLFILNAAYDAWQIKNILAPSAADPKKSWNNCKLDIKHCTSNQLQIMQGFHLEFLKPLPKLGNSSVGMFINSCYAHCQSGSQDTWLAADSPMLDKNPIAKAVGDWFYGRRTFQKIDCPYPCDSSCRNRVYE